MKKRLIRAILPILAIATLAVAASYEKPPVLRASDVLPADLLQGDRYTIEESVANDGMMNTFVVASDFGRFEAYGEKELRIRIHEISALDELDGLSKSEVFVKAVGEGALKSLKGFQAIATRPVETAKGLPEGVGRFFKRSKHSAAAGYDAAKGLVTDDDDADAEAGEGSGQAEADDQGRTEEATDQASAYAKKYFGVNSAQRRWAQKLEVDPYTSNKVLHEAIKDVAEVDAAARFAVRLAPIPRVPGASYANKVTSLVWNREPWELVEENKKALVEAGAREENIESFFANESYSPSVQTILVKALLDLKGAEDLSLALDQASTAQSEDEARFFTQGAVLLRWFHHKQSPIVRMLPGGRVFVGVTEDGRAIAVPPVDDLFWVKELAQGIEAETERISAEGGGLEIWALGGVSDEARAALEELGWGVQTEVGAKMKQDPVEEKEPEKAG